ncbi:carboxymuconolactone decarboxylase family protein [Sorangium sp. So ce1151]|uniref:carboxymuconolactone decarboxylase family protein n=1 Tax=Sorangium sp. So ce1151 TaxID=3133332 RepID=UPI003F633C6C
MAVVKLLANDEVPPEAQALFARVEAEYGFVPNILKAIAHCPELLTTFVPFWATVYRSPTIGPKLRALAALGTAKAQQCDYCMSHMTVSARRAGYSPEQIQAIDPAGGMSGLFDERETAIVEYADALTLNPKEVPPELKRKLRALFTDAELVNITIAVGLYNLTSRFLNGLEVDVESIFDSGQRAAAK